MIYFICLQETCKKEGGNNLNTQFVLSKNIRKLINEKGLKQKAVANRCKINERNFSNMLCNRQLIRPEHIPMIASALDVSIDDLFKTDSKE